MSDQSSIQSIWQTAYGELQLQLPREAFDTWLRQARLLAHEDGTFIIGVQNVYAREWLEHRLKKVIVRTLSQVAGRGVEVRFVVWSGEEQSADLREAGPLLAEMDSPAEAPRFERLSPGETGLNPRLTFDWYAVGACNRLAHAAALAAVENPAGQFNPLYLHASVGLGKTHLLHAIGNACLQRELRVLFVSAETFTNDLVAAIHSKNTSEFRQKYRGVDVLLVDDLNFIAGKDSTQEEFYHTFNDLHQAGAQIVAAASQPPGLLHRLDERLVSRFAGGLVVELSPPDFATRMEILQLKARLRGMDARIPVEVLEVIAGEGEGSVREIEGALNRLVAASLVSHEAPTVSLAEIALNEARAAQRDLTLEDIIMAVAEFYSFLPDDLTGRARACSREVSSARQVVMYLARKETDASLQIIGETLGGRNHSTVLYSCERIDELMKTDSQIRRDITAIQQTLRPQGDPARKARR